jgi:dipeptidyl aminopeptidase/acylaminoacyl peptidase
MALSVAGPLSAQQVRETEYARADQFLAWNANRLVTGTQVAPHWLSGDRFWYRNRVREGHEFVLVDPARSTRRPVFDHARLAAALSTAADTSYVPNKLPFQDFEFADGERSIRFHLGDSIRWTCDITTYECLGPDSVPRRPRHEIRSPDGAWAAFQRDENLWIRDTETDEEIQLSQDGEEHYGYAVQPEGCCQEITTRRGGSEPPPVLEWSPNSKRIATHRYDEREVGELHLLETAVGRPKLHSYRYALPGDSLIPTFDIHVFDVAERSSIRLDQEPLIGDFTQPDTTWAPVQWSPDGSRLLYTRRSRDFKELELMVGDAATGETRTILTETGPTLREMSPMIGQDNWRVVGQGEEVVWYSERDGWGHLYLVDATTGTIKSQITSGPWLVFEVLRVDEATRRIYFTAVGRENGRDPYLRHLYSANLDGSGITLLTPEDADHAVTVSPSGRYFLDTYSRRDTHPVTVVRDPNGRELQTVETADISELLATGWQPPTPFKVKGRDGVTDVFGYLYFPTDFDPEKKYPVVDYVYPGPQIGPVGLRSFSLGGWAGQHALPELGFIVFTIDAFGTPVRSKVFHDGYYGNMGDNGIPDHMAALRQLAMVHPQLDLDRVGIFGHSGGGFASTDALLRYPDFFKVAVSGAGNHDNRSYLFAWGERYQGLLVRDTLRGGDNYDSQANQNLAANLKGKLLLSYGSLDDNVHPNATLLVIQELIKHNKDFDLFVMPNRNHGHAGEPYSIRRTWDYFVEHLLGADPPHQYKMSDPPGG